MSTNSDRSREAMLKEWETRLSAWEERLQAWDKKLEEEKEALRIREEAIGAQEGETRTPTEARHPKAKQKSTSTANKEPAYFTPEAHQTGTVQLTKTSNFVRPRLQENTSTVLGDLILSKDHIKIERYLYLSQKYTCIIRLGGGLGWAFLYCPICGCNAKVPKTGQVALGRKGELVYLNGLDGLIPHIDHAHKEIMSKEYGSPTTISFLQGQDCYTVLSEDEVLAIQIGRKAISMKSWDAGGAKLYKTRDMADREQERAQDLREENEERLGGANKSKPASDELVLATCSSLDIHRKEVDDAMTATSPATAAASPATGSGASMMGMGGDSMGGGSTNMGDYRL